MRIEDLDISYRLIGDDATTIFITQGLGFASAEWWPLQDRLSREARVLTWDRPGYGSSGVAATARTVGQVAAEALALVDRVAPDSALVLVGHSQGGLYTNALARLAGPRVRGVVLLDPAHPDNGRLRRELSPELFRRSRSDLSVGLQMGRRMARLHVMGLLKPVLMQGPPFMYCRQHPRAARDAMWRHTKRPQAYDAALAEYEELEFRTTSTDVDALGAFPPVRLTVLVHDPALMVDDFVKRAHLSRPDAQRVEELWGSLLRDHGALSPMGNVEAVAGSGHLIHLEQPDLTMARISELVQGAV